MQVAETILNQLGGRQFTAMTGSKNFLSDGNKLIMTLARNAAGVNKLEIELNGKDLYNMKFYKITIGQATGVKISKTQIFEDVYDDMLAGIFTKVTGLYTKF